MPGHGALQTRRPGSQSQRMGRATFILVLIGASQLLARTGLLWNCSCTLHCVPGGAVVTQEFLSPPPPAVSLAFFPESARPDSSGANCEMVTQTSRNCELRPFP